VTEDLNTLLDLRERHEPRWSKGDKVAAKVTEQTTVWKELSEDQAKRLTETSVQRRVLDDVETAIQDRIEQLDNEIDDGQDEDEVYVEKRRYAKKQLEQILR